MKLFCKNSKRPKTILFFRKKAPAEMFCRVLNTSVYTSRNEATFTWYLFSHSYLSLALSEYINGFSWIIRSITRQMFYSDGRVVKALDSQSRGPMFKTKIDSAVHPFEIDKMSTRDFWELSGKKLNCLLKVALALRQLNLIHKKEPQSFKSFFMYMLLNAGSIIEKKIIRWSTKQ